MKKSILFVALVAVFVLSFATAAFAIGPFYTATYDNTIYAGAGNYLNWDTAATFAGNTGTSPHGGYTANTNKCAVCHSVHQAAPGKSVLTAGGPYATYAQGCVFCHAEGNTFTNVVMTANADGYISPHGTCTRCHALNPHGVGTSQYVTLASKLINTNPDTWITADLAASNNGINIGMFDGTGNVAAGSTLGTGYLCGNCHAQGFAVNTAGADPAGGGTFTGHRVTAMATATWSGASYGASLASASTTTVAWAGNGTCQGCHDAKTTSGDNAFPHGYVDAAGALSPKTVAGSSYIWLTTAADANDAHVLLGGEEPQTGLGDTNLLTEDGLCLKCHRSDTGVGVPGVGQTF